MAKTFKKRYLWQNIKFLFSFFWILEVSETHCFTQTDHTYIHTYIYILIYIHTWQQGYQLLHWTLYIFWTHRETEADTYFPLEPEASKQAGKKRSSRASRACCSILAGGGGGGVHDLLWLVLSSLYPILFSTNSGSLFLYKPISSSPLHTHLFV